MHGDVTHQNAVTFRAQLATQMKTTLSSSFLTVDLQQVRRLFEGVPWVREAVVQRKFPNRLRVTLREHQPVAWWGESGSGQLVNDAGEVFDASPDDIDGLPELAGPAEQSARVWALYEPLAADLERLNLAWIGWLWMNAAAIARATLHNGARIELGRGTQEELLARVARFTATLSRKLTRITARSNRWTCATPTATRCACAASPPPWASATNPNPTSDNHPSTTMAKEYKDLVVGLDIGTAKIMVVVAEVLAGGANSSWPDSASPPAMASGAVTKIVDLDRRRQSIQAALKEAELMADCRIARVYTGITGSHIRYINSSGMVAIKDREVTAADVARVIETAKAINISTDQRLLLVEPQEFVIDGQEVREPIGVGGIRLEAKIHIVTGAQSAAENIIKCVRRCGLEVDQLMLNPLASSQAVLTDDEKDLGVALVDIGAGTTDVAIFAGGAIRHTAVIPIAGDLITSDIAMALRTPTKDAEDGEEGEAAAPSSCWPTRTSRSRCLGWAIVRRACSAARRWLA